MLPPTTYCKRRRKINTVYSHSSAQTGISHHRRLVWCSPGIGSSKLFEQETRGQRTDETLETKAGISDLLTSKSNEHHGPTPKDCAISIQPIAYTTNGAIGSVSLARGCSARTTHLMDSVIPYHLADDRGLRGEITERRSPRYRRQHTCSEKKPPEPSPHQMEKLLR